MKMCTTIKTITASTSIKNKCSLLNHGQEGIKQKLHILPSEYKNTQINLIDGVAESLQTEGVFMEQTSILISVFQSVR